jgi:hypothetical protein
MHGVFGVLLLPRDHAGITDQATCRKVVERAQRSHSEFSQLGCPGSKFIGEWAVGSLHNAF